MYVPERTFSLSSVRTSNPRYLAHRRLRPSSFMAHDVLVMTLRLNRSSDVDLGHQYQLANSLDSKIGYISQTPSALRSRGFWIIGIDSIGEVEIGDAASV